jgi:DNA-binding transcriptional regulator YiaG
MPDKSLQRVIASASDLLGREELAVRLGVDAKVLESWIAGRATMPGVKLRLLTIALADFAAQKPA